MKIRILMVALILGQNALAAKEYTSSSGLQLNENAHGYLHLYTDISTAKRDFSRKLQEVANSDDKETAEKKVISACYHKLERMTADRLILRNVRLLEAKKVGTQSGTCGDQFTIYRVKIQEFQAKVTGCTARCSVITLANGTTKSTCRSELTYDEFPTDKPFTTYGQTYFAGSLPGCTRWN